jgi:hypothetical protein
MPLAFESAASYGIGCSGCSSAAVDDEVGVKGASWEAQGPAVFGIFSNKQI